jgi:hypothetical protein
VRSHAMAAFAVPTHRENSRFSLGVIAAMLVCATAFLGIGAPAASAAPTATTGYSYLTSFGAGEFAGPNDGSTASIGIDQTTGNILVSDFQARTVRVFEPDPITGGAPLTTFETEYEVEPGTLAPGLSSMLAVDPDEGTAYPAVGGGPGDSSLVRYETDGAPTPTYTRDPSFSQIRTPGDLGHYGSWAFDPTTGDLLYVAFNGRVERFDPSTGEKLSTIALKAQSRVLAVAPDGSLYVSGRKQSLAHYSSTGTLLGELPLPGALLDIAINPTTGEIVASYNPSDGGPRRLRGFTSTGELVFDTPAPSVGTYGLAIDGDSNRLYSFTGSEVIVFAPAVFPGAEVPVVSAITPTSAHLSAEVDPGAGPPAESEAHFEYSADGGATWTSTPNQPLTGPGTIEADLTGLEVNWDYLVRFVAKNSATEHTTDSKAFTTAGVPAEAETSDATGITETSAVLNGTINPVGLQTTYHFEYGLTAAYGSRVPVATEAAAGGTRTKRSFSRTIAGLTPGATYHYRIVAENSAGISEGADRTFTTAAAAAIPQRFYEQVSPVDHEGDTIESKVGFLASPDGDAFSYLGHTGKESSPLFSRQISIRGSDDWHGGVYLDPPLNTSRVSPLFYPTLAVSSDFTHAFVVSNRDLTGDGDEDGTNLYVEDIASGQFTLVATAVDPGAIVGFAGNLTGGRFQAAAPDLSWVVFSSPFPLYPGAPQFGMYRWSLEGGLELFSVLPGGAPANAAQKSGSSGGGPRYVAEDGSRVYFTTFKEPVEAVYMREPGQAEAQLISHTPAEPSTPQEAHLLDVSKDGRYAFLFSAGAKLTDDAPGNPGDLYRYDAVEDSLEYLGAQAWTEISSSTGQPEAASAISDDGGTFYFISGPTQGPTMVWRKGHLATLPGLVGLHRSLSPDGRYYAWESGEGGPVYVYDAETEEEQCVSCLPDGTPVPASMPDFTLYTNGRLPRAVTDSGQVFVTTSARLAATDVNGTSDVYMYQGGQHFLISPGNSPFPAIFADISENGRDVFFSTGQKLVGQDTNGAPDFYDARIGGGLAAQNPPPPQECLRDDCKETPNAGPELPFGGSEALSGPGNVSPARHKKCGKGKRAKKVKGKVRCVKKKKAGKDKKGGNR